jgi:hypothetical protein
VGDKQISDPWFSIRLSEGGIPHMLYSELTVLPSDSTVRYSGSQSLGRLYTAVQPYTCKLVDDDC